MAARQEDMLLEQERQIREQGRLETVEMEMQRMQSQVDALAAAQTRPGRDAALETLQNDVGALSRRVAALEAARAKDRQEIVDTLSRKMADLMKSTAPRASSAPIKKATSAAATKTGYGLEHVVQSGETLSAIASAYGVKMSAIAELNHIKDPSSLRVGQKLIIPE
jgi:LysM repeat protein